MGGTTWKYSEGRIQDQQYQTQDQLAASYIIWQQMIETELGGLQEPFKKLSQQDLEIESEMCRERNAGWFSGF